MVDQLPSFEFPPIDEMVIGVQFHPIKHFRMVHLWKYWSSVSERYPVCEDQSPLPHVVENPAVDPQKAQGFVQLSPFTGRVPVPRCWLIDSSKNELIQVQQDRFLRNWRRVQGNEVYPRFGTLFDRFFVEWTGFRGFLESEKLGRPHLDQFELSYINVIEPSPTWKGLSGLQEAFTPIRQPNNFLPEPEVVTWESAYVLPDGQGRLNVNLAPVFRARDFKVVINFTLTARGLPNSDSDESLRDWFSLGHEWIVRAFDELTTPTMHRIWKKKS